MKKLYKKNEFCHANSCSWLHPISKRCANKNGNCCFTAREFHHWLKKNDYTISKEEVEMDINKRWEKGIDHHPESEKMVRIIAELDFKYGDDFFCLKIGGDGDNGEHLMYLLDIYFERRDLKIHEKNNHRRGKD